MTDQQIIDEINRAKQFKQLGQFSMAHSILQKLEQKLEPVDDERLMLAHVYKARGKIYYIEGDDENCYIKCLLSAKIFAIHEDQAEAFNVAGTIGALHPDFSPHRKTYANSLQGIGKFTNQEVAISMAQVGIATLQKFFGQ